jgi:phage tail sheath gpL-like
MSTLSLALTGFSTLLPGTYIEVKFAQGQANGASASKKVLFIGAKTTAGSATTDTIVYAIGAEADAITYFGAGSKVHRTARRFMHACPDAQCFGIVAAESVGAIATDNVTFAGVAGSAGVVTYTLCGETIQVAIPNGTAAAASGALFTAMVNLQTHWPVVAVDGGAGVVTINAKIKGTDGNHIRHRISTTTTTQTAACGATVLASGATDEVLTTVLASILADDYDYIVLCANPTAAANVRLGALATQVINQALPTTGIRQQVIFGSSVSQANAVSLSAGVLTTAGPANNPRFCHVYQENSEWEPMELAGYVAGVRFATEAGSNPWANYDSWGLHTGEACAIPKQYANGDYPTRTEQATLIAGGVTPIAVNTLGKTYIVQMVTCSTDVRVRDVAKVTVADAFADDLAVRYNTSGYTALQDDPVNEGDVPKNVCTPSRLKNQTIKPLYIQYVANGWLHSAMTLDGATADILACTTGIDPVVNTRINARIPLHVMPLCHQFAALVTENSAG